MVFSFTFDIFAGDFNAFNVLRYVYFNILGSLKGRSFGPGANIFHLSPIPGVNLDPAMFRTRAILQEKMVYCDTFLHQNGMREEYMWLQLQLSKPPSERTKNQSPILGQVDAYTATVPSQMISTMALLSLI